MHRSPGALLRLARYTLSSDIVDVPVSLVGRRVRAEAVRAVGGTPSLVVDLLTGTGSTLLEYAGRFPSTRIVAIDLDPGVLAVARERLLARGFANLETIVGDARDVPLPAGAADVVNISFGLHENRRVDRLLILGEACRLLREGGELVVIDYREFRGPAKRALGRVYFLLFEPRWVSELFRGGLEREVAQAGFEIERTRELPLSRLVVARKP